MQPGSLTRPPCLEETGLMICRLLTSRNSPRNPRPEQLALITCATLQDAYAALAAVGPRCPGCVTICAAGAAHGAGCSALERLESGFVREPGQGTLSRLTGLCRPLRCAQLHSLHDVRRAAAARLELECYRAS